MDFQKKLSDSENSNIADSFHGHNQSRPFREILVVLSFDPSSKCCKRIGGRINRVLNWGYIAVTSLGKYQLLL